jgi:hypothetical protein
MKEDEHLEVWLWTGFGHAMATAVIVKDGEKEIGWPIKRVMISERDETAVLNLGKIVRGASSGVREARICLEEFSRSAKSSNEKGN